MQLNNPSKLFYFLFLFCLACENTAQDQNTDSKTNAVENSEPTTLSKISDKTFSGDFNGDGLTDELYLVDTIELSKSGIEIGSKHAGWTWYGEGKAPTEAGKLGPVSIVVVENSKATRIIVSIYDPNNISILSAPAASGIFVISQSDKDNLAWNEIGDSIKGDALVIPTEAGMDSYFGWNGEKYTGIEILDIP